MTIQVQGKGLKYALLLSGILLIPFATQASVVVTGTRVIYPADAREVTVKLNNDGSFPALVQSWIDNGDPQATPDVASSPFMLTPPIARIDSQKGQTLRLRFVGDKQLPQDKESVFWLNILELPPSADDGENKLKIAFRTRLKIFYRPVGLADDPMKAASQIEWRTVRNGNKLALDAFNPGDYYVSLNSVRIGNQVITLSINDGFIAPKQHQRFKENINAASGSRVKYATINDYGAVSTWESPLKNE